MSTHNICFRGEIRKILCGYPLLSVAMRIALCEVYSCKQTAKNTNKNKQIDT